MPPNDYRRIEKAILITMISIGLIALLGFKLLHALPKIDPFLGILLAVLIAPFILIFSVVTEGDFLLYLSMGFAPIVIYGLIKGYDRKKSLAILLILLLAAVSSYRITELTKRAAERQAQNNP